MIEAFLTKIAAAVFKKALVWTGLEALATAYEIYSVVETISDVTDCLDSVNDCNSLAVSGLHVISDSLTQVAVDRLMEIGSQTFTVEQTESGIYVASPYVPSFRAPSGSIPTGVFRGGAGRFSSGNNSKFSSGGRGRFTAGGRG